MKDIKPSGKICPREFFQVSDDVSYLELFQLRALEAAFDAWRNGAKRSDSVLGRTRIWVVFHLLRHTGARLGEILSLDDTACFDPSGPAILLGRGERKRRVPLSEEVYETVSAILDGPLAAKLRGTFLHIDPGYFRRTCYARGKECSLSKDQVGPNALRNTRAVEMLRNGVPITIVRDLLGQSSLDLTAGFQQFSEGDVRSIINAAHQSMRKRTSARNSFVGHVTDVREDPVMTEISLATRTGLLLSAVITTHSLRNLDLREGSPLVATVKAPLVNVLRPEATPPGSARNRLPATVLRVARSPVLAEVVGQLEDGTEVCALISGQSADELGLEPGDRVEFWFKALSVVLNTVRT